jgi:hypothetical protein
MVSDRNSLINARRASIFSDGTFLLICTLIIWVSPFLFVAASLNMNPSSKWVVDTVAHCLTLGLKVREVALQGGPPPGMAKSHFWRDEVSCPPINSDKPILRRLQ